MAENRITDEIVKKGIEIGTIYVIVSVIFGIFNGLTNAYKTEKMKGVMKYISGIVTLGLGIISSMCCIGLTALVGIASVVLAHNFFVEGSIYAHTNKEFVNQAIGFALADVASLIIAVMSFMLFTKIYRSFKQHEEEEEGIKAYTIEY